MEGVLERLRINAHGVRHVGGELAHRGLHGAADLGAERGAELLLQGRAELSGDLAHERRHDLLHVVAEHGLQLRLKAVQVDDPTRLLDQFLPGIGGDEQREVRLCIGGVGVIADAEVEIAADELTGDFTRQVGVDIVQTEIELADDACDIQFGQRRGIDLHGGQIHRGRVEAQTGKIEIQPRQIHRERRLVECESRGESVLVHGHQRTHIEIAVLRILRLVGESASGKDVDVRIGQLFLDDLGLGCLVDQVGGQIGGVVQARGKCRRGCPAPRPDDAGDAQLLTAVHEVSHEIGVAALVGPDVVGRVESIVIGGIHQLERHIHDLVVGECLVPVGRGDDRLIIDQLLHHGIQLGGIAKSHGVQHEIAHPAVVSQHHDDLVVAGRPVAGNDVVLRLDQ